MDFEENIMIANCDTLTCLRDPAKRVSVLSLSSFSLLPVIHLTAKSNTLLNVNNQSHGAEDWRSWVSSANLRWPHLLSEITSGTGWMYRVKNNGPKTETPGNHAVKFLLWRDPTTDTYSLDSIRQVRRKPFESLERYAEHIMQPCEENVTVQRIERSWQTK